MQLHASASILRLLLAAATLTPLATAVIGQNDLFVSCGQRGSVWMYCKRWDSDFAKGCCRSWGPLPYGSSPGPASDNPDGTVDLNQCSCVTAPDQQNLTDDGVRKMLDQYAPPFDPW